MKWYWYVARPDELLCDLDRCPPEKLANVGRRLRGASETHALPVRDVWLYPSGREWHYHLIIRLQKELTDAERFAWELYLRSDPFRTCNNLARAARNSGAADLLLTTAPWSRFYRSFDHSCGCGEKHGRGVMASCPVALKLRGADRVRHHFGFPSEDGLAWRFGRVELPVSESLGIEDSPAEGFEE